MKNCEKIAFLIDISSHMEQTHQDTNVTMLEYSLRAVIATIWRRVLSNRNDLFTVFFIGASQSDNNQVLKGVNHIRCMDFADQDLFHILNPANVSVSTTADSVDVLAGFEQALYHFHELDVKNKSQLEKNETIVLFSNFTNFPNGFNISTQSTEIFTLIKGLNNRNIEIVLTGMHLETIKKCESPLKYLLSYERTIIIPFNTAISIIGRFKKREYQQIAQYHGPLIFGDQFSLEVSCYSFVIDTHMPKFTKFNTEISNFDVQPSKCGLSTSKRITDSEGNLMSSKFIQRVFAFGSEKIPINNDFNSLLKNMALDNFKGIFVIGFTSLDNFVRPLFPGSSLLFVVPKDVSKNNSKKSDPSNDFYPDKNASAFFHLLSRLNDRNMGIVVGCRMRHYVSTKLCLMVPHIKTNPKMCGFLLVRLPFYNDIRCNNLAINPNYSKSETSDSFVTDKLKNLIESNTIPINDIANQLNPQYQSYCNLVVNKYLGYKLEIPINNQDKNDPTHLKNTYLIQDIKQHLDIE